MQVEKRALELISQKYYSPIETLHDDKNTRVKSIVDTSNGSLFCISNSYCSFKDQDGNIWLTIPKKVIINEKRYYPVIGDTYICDDIRYSFTTIDKIVEMASDYFEKFIIPYFGLQIYWRICHFQDILNGTKCHYKLYEMKFKSSSYKEIQAYISSN